MAAVVQAALGTGSDDYATAHRVQQQTGRPMVVVVGAEWCPACRDMKRLTLPLLERRGLFRDVCVAEVDADREPGLARKLMSGGTIPQTIVFGRTPAGAWRRTVLVGRQSPETVEAAVRTVMAQAKPSDAPTETPASTVHTVAKPAVTDPQPMMK
jgi:thioredoxin-like negative regulator of GroEL